MDIVAVGLGEVLWDVLPGGKKIGGAPANFAYHVSQFGIESHVASAVGSDKLGDEALDVLNGKGIDTSYIKRVGYPTGAVRVALDEKGVPEYRFDSATAWDNIPFTADMKELAERTTLVCFGSLAQREGVSRQTIRSFLQAMPVSESTLKVFDVNFRQNFYGRDVVETSLKMCNVLKINDEEIVEIARMFGWEGHGIAEVCRRLMEAFDLKVLILTCGTEGSYVYWKSPDGSEEHFLDTPRVEVADTVGAGDAFTAAFCASVAKGKDIAEAHGLAVDVSAYVCSCRGAMPELPKSLKER